MKAFPLTRVTTLAGYVSTLIKVGAPVDAGLRRARLPVLFDERPDAWVPFRQLRKFISYMAYREGIPDLAFHKAEFRSVFHARFIHPVLVAPTLKVGLKRLAEGSRYQTTHMRVWLESAQDRARFCMRFPFSPDSPGHSISETRTLKLAQQVIQAFAGPEFEPTRIMLTSRRRDLRFDLELAYKGVPVLTDQPYGAIEFPRALLSLACPPSHTPTTSLTRAGDDGPDSSSLAATLAVCLVPYLLSGYPPIDFAAEISGCSVRTLQRHLRKEGTTYSEVVDGARCRSALSHLRAEKVNIARLAGQLGFSEHSAFTRAFARWTGTTPTAYRAAAAETSIYG
jgi:AraC-like DNA-binding protein